MTLFSSTSPSYLILQSLDMANRYLSDGYRGRLAETAKRISELKAVLREKGFELIGEETLKLTVSPKTFGYTGSELAKILHSHSIYCEFSDPDYIVFMFTPETEFSEIDFLQKILLSVERKDCIRDKMPDTIFSRKSDDSSPGYAVKGMCFTCRTVSWKGFLHRKMSHVPAWLFLSLPAERKLMKQQFRHFVITA